MSAQIVHAVFVSITAFILSIAIAPGLIKYLRKIKFGQTIREDGPETHKSKAGIPTMGGIIFLFSAIISTLLVKQWPERMFFLLFIVLSFGLIGLVDDLLIVIKKRSLGLKAREKILFQTILSFLFALYLYTHQDTTAGLTWRVPFSNFLWTLPPWLFLFLTTFILVATANAVKLTDGLDGLAVGTSGISLMALAIICYWSGYPDIMVFCLALTGACLGFAWFNAHPAQVFMGDTGSLALGGAIGGIAIMSGNALFIPFLGGVFVAETLSVIIQVLLFKFTGQRFFKMSPLHHHFELSGWDEPKIVIRFWIAGLILAIIGLLGYVRG